jgi:hypothetical protein
MYLQWRAKSNHTQIKKLGMAPPDIATLSQEMGNSRLTAGTVIHTNAPEDKKDK